MNIALKPMLALLMFVTVAACSGPSPNMIRISEEMIEQNETAVVVLRVNGRGPGLFGTGETDRSLFTALRAVNSQQHFYMWDKYHDVQIRHVKPGRYQFHSFTYGDMTMVAEPLTEMEYDPNVHVPVRPFEVKAGEVVYLGTLVVNGVYHERPIYAGDEKASYRVESNEQEARAALEDKMPGMAAKMETRLLVVDEQTKDAGNFVD